MSNGTEELCHKELAENPPSLIQDGHIIFQAHHIGWIVSGAFALVATITSFWLISKHLQWYTNKREQRYIVRLLFLVPLYAIISFASFVFWNQSTPIILIRDAYEAIVLTAFFYLLLMYLSHDTEEQKRIFLKAGLSLEFDALARHKGEMVSKWVFPMGFVKWKPRDGLYFLQLMKWGVLQYCVIRPVTTLAAVILDYMGLYCESSWGLGWGHIYITLIISVSVTIAMYCLIQLYVPVAKELAPHKPLLKLFSVKAVVFLTFWQATFLSVLGMFGVVKDTKYMTAEDINIGISALLETFEMMQVFRLFAFLHIRAFTYKPYMLGSSKLSNGIPPTRTPQWRSLGHAMDFRETFREIWVGCIYMFDNMRGKEPTPDFGAKRAAHYEGAFGRPRLMQGKPMQYAEKVDKVDKLNDVTFPAVEIEVDHHVEVEIEGQRQWLGLGKHDRYGFNPRLERSDGLQEQIDQELERLGYPRYHANKGSSTLEVDLQPGGRRSSWWRNIYNRMSQSGHDPGEGEQFEESPVQRKSSKLHSSRQHLRTDTHLHDIDRDIDDRPPRSMLHPFKGHSSGSTAYQDYYQDQSFTEDDRLLLPSNDDDHRRRNHNRDQRIVAPISPTSSKKATRTHRMDPIFPASNMQSLNGDGSTVHNGPHSAYGPISPVQYQRDPRSRGAASPGVRSKSRSSRIPLRESLISPPPLSVRRDPGPYQENHRRQDLDQNAERPPATPPKDTSTPLLHSFPEEDTVPAPYRKSFHRREGATMPRVEEDGEKQTQSSPPPSAANRYSGVPVPVFMADRSYIPHVVYIKQPTNKRTSSDGLR